MSESNLPPRLASWLLRHLGCSPNNDAIFGDIQERFARGQSRLWYWREVAAAIIAGVYVSILSERNSHMKRAIVWTSILIGVFALGYWTALSPIIIREEMPSATEMAEMQQRRWLAVRMRSNFRNQGLVDFLRKVVKAAELDYKKTGTAESKAKLDLLRSNLEQAQQYVYITREATKISSKKSEPPR